MTSIHNIPWLKADGAGRIVEYGELSPHSYLHLLGYLYNPIGARPSTHYVDGGIVRDRPAMQLGRVGNRLINLPDPCQIEINGTVYQVEGGEVDLDFPQSGTYRLLIQAWPYKDSELEVIHENSPR